MSSRWSTRIEPGEGQESVWDYPRPPVVQPQPGRVRLWLGGVQVVDTTDALRVLETSHPPTVYLPLGAFTDCEVRPAPGRSMCEFKGSARYHDLIAGGVVAPAAAWGYDHPWEGFQALAGHVAVYPGRVDAAMVDDEVVAAQEGDFYGGWVTARVVGPFKGAPGTRGW